MVTLKPHDIAHVRTVGDLTFIPLSGGKFRCKQLPYLGRLSRTDKASVIQQVGPTHFNEAVKVEPYIPKLFLIRFGEWTCIECKQFHHGSGRSEFRTDGQVMSCVNCHTKWCLTLIKTTTSVASTPPPLSTGRRVGMRWEQKCACPHCERVNPRAVAGSTHRCRHCLMRFLVPK